MEAQNQSRLLDQVRERCRVKHYSLHTEQAYVQLIASLMYGSGLRLMETMRLRVKDVDLARREITVQELLVHSDVRTTQIYTHLLNRGGRGVRSPLDAG